MRPVPGHHTPNVSASLEELAVAFNYDEMVFFRGGARCLCAKPLPHIEYTGAEKLSSSSSSERGTGVRVRAKRECVKVYTCGVYVFDNVTFIIILSCVWVEYLRLIVMHKSHFVAMCGSHVALQFRLYSEPYFNAIKYTWHTVFVVLCMCDCDDNIFIRVRCLAHSTTVCVCVCIYVQSAAPQPEPI